MSRAPARIAMSPPHPGAFIREEILDELGLSVSEAAKVLDVRRATLSDLINGNAALSAEMALRIEKAFGVKMETLLNIQAWYDAHAMRQREGEIEVKPYRPPAPGRADPSTFPERRLCGFPATTSMPPAATRQAPARSLPNSPLAHGGCRRCLAWRRRPPRMRRCIRRGCSATSRLARCPATANPAPLALPPVLAMID
jgi:antitoxin HigA-1